VQVTGCWLGKVQGSKRKKEGISEVAKKLLRMGNGMLPAGEKL
jgi:hypothetical protein